MRPGRWFCLRGGRGGSLVEARFDSMQLSASGSSRAIASIICDHHAGARCALAMTYPRRRWRHGLCKRAVTIFLATLSSRKMPHATKCITPARICLRWACCLAVIRDSSSAWMSKTPARATFDATSVRQLTWKTSVNATWGRPISNLIRTGTHLLHP